MGLLLRGHQVALVKGASSYWSGVLGRPPARQRGFEVVSQPNTDEVEVRVGESIQKVPIEIVTLVGGRPKKPLD